MKNLQKILPSVIKLLIAAAIVSLLIGFNADGHLLQALKTVHPGWIALAAALYAFHIFANAWRWYLLLRIRHIDCTLWEACSLTMQSFFFSLVIPGGAIGGDLVRAAFLARKVPAGQKFEGAFTILMDRFTGMIGIFLVALLILPFCMKYMDTKSDVMTALVWMLLAGSFCGLLAAAAVFQHRYFEKLAIFRKFRALIDRFSGGLFSKVIDALDGYSDSKGLIVLCIFMSITLVNLVLGGVACCVSLAVKPDWNAPMSSLGAITIGNIAGLLPLTPSGVGPRDFFVIPILERGGMSQDQALASALCITALILLFNLAGGLFFIFSKHPKNQETK